jgi:hypothetical protein
MMTLEQRILDVLERHGPRTKEEVIRDITAAELQPCDQVEQYGQAIEQLADDGKLYRAYENRWAGIGNPDDSTNNPLAFFTRTWYEKSKDNSAYAFYNSKK